MVVSLENWAEDCGAKPCTRSSIMLYLLPGFIKYLPHVTLTAKSLVALIVLAVLVFSHKLSDELNIDDGDVGSVPSNLGGGLSSCLDRSSNLNLLQLFRRPVEKIFGLELVQKFIFSPIIW